MAHFHDVCRERHAGERSYTWVKNRLQESGLASKGKRRGTPRRRCERAPIPGLLVHQDGSSHEWVPGSVWDLIVTMDDATPEVYSGSSSREEGTWSSLRGVRETLAGRGLLSSLYTGPRVALLAHLALDRAWREPKHAVCLDSNQDPPPDVQSREHVLRHH